MNIGARFRTGFVLTSLLLGCVLTFGQDRPAVRSIFKDAQVAALANAAARGDVRTIDRLVRDGVNINAEGDEGWTPLAYATLSLNKRGFEKLLQLGADPNHMGTGVPIGGTVMTMVAQADDRFFLEKAVEYGGDINVRGTQGGRTPIWHAILARRMKNLTFLIEKGADLDAPEETGWTALVNAMAITNYEAAMLLFEGGADWRAEIHIGGVWRDGKREGGEKVNAMVHYLVKYTNSRGPDKKSKVWELRTKMIQMLHGRGAEFTDDVLQSAGIKPSTNE